LHPARERLMASVTVAPAAKLVRKFIAGSFLKEILGTEQPAKRRHRNSAGTILRSRRIR